MTDDTPKFPLSGDINIDAIDAFMPAPAVPAAPNPQRPKPKHKTAQNIAWTRDVLPTLPPRLQLAIYHQILAEVKAEHLPGWVLLDQPLKMKVIIPQNGRRERTFRQIVLKPGRRVQHQLDQLYASVRVEQDAKDGGRHLTLEEALELND